MRTLLVATLGLAFLAFGHAEEKKAVPKELQPLQGKWKPLTMTIGGKVRKAPVEFMEFDGAIVYDVKGGEREKPLKVKVDVTKTPMTVDVSDGELKVYGIWKLEKDTLTLCFVKGGGQEKDRPAKFESPKDTEVALIELEKAK